MKIVLSCTTTVNRLNIFYYGVQSLLGQSLMPDLFIVNLSEEDFLPKGTHKIPNWLYHEEITINLTQDLGPYTKFVPTIRYADNDDLIITADDDILYGRNWLEKLVSESLILPSCIICTRARLMRKNIFNRWMNYANWENLSQETVSIDLLPLGVGGIVYRKRLLDMDFLLGNDFLKIASGTDDLWFKMASMRLATKIKVIPSINLENMKIIHPKGLEELNIKKIERKIIGKLFSRVCIEIKNYLGINLSINDNNWDAILKIDKDISQY